MAPEVLTHKGYSFQVDLWAIGTFIFSWMNYFC
jgi:serine/threonine protein kinase